MFVGKCWENLQKWGVLARWIHADAVDSNGLASLLSISPVCGNNAGRTQPKETKIARSREHLQALPAWSHSVIKPHATVPRRCAVKRTAPAGNTGRIERSNAPSSHGRVETIATDGLKSYSAALRELGNLDRREVGRHLKNRVENSHLPFRRRERAMLRFRQMKSLQEFVSVHANVHNHFNQERHLIDRKTYKARRSAALAEWQSGHFRT